MDASNKKIIKIARHQTTICWLVITGLFGLDIKPIGLIVGIILIYQVYLLAESLELKHPWGYSLGVFIPIFSLFILWRLMKLSTKTLQQNNVRVGLMGGKKEDLSKLIEEST